MDNTLNDFRAFLQGRMQGKKILLLGFGREGQSSWKMLHGLLPEGSIGIADRNPDTKLDGLPTATRIHTGAGYLDSAADYDVCLCSPGIPYHQLSQLDGRLVITSQTDLFLEYFAPRCIGITGTKGKSTTSTLVHHMLNESSIHTVLAGNIGLPPFEAAGTKQGSNSVFVLELSAHQLAFIRRAPHLACILNLYEEHLDHFPTLNQYFLAKWNIGLRQLPGDHLILSGEDTMSSQLLEKQPISSVVSYFCGNGFEGFEEGDFSEVKLEPWGNTLILNPAINPAFRGVHQRKNAVAAAILSMYAGANGEGVQHALDSFRGLPHRLEYVGEVNGVQYFNDAIATIPEAVIEALRSLGRVNTLILGGMDRGISYEGLITHLCISPPDLIVLSGPAGKRMTDLLDQQNYPSAYKYFSTFLEAMDHAVENTSPGGIALLSPAAPSYDEFRDFTEKGNAYKKRTGSHV